MRAAVRMSDALAWRSAAETGLVSHVHVHVPLLLLLLLLQKQRTTQQAFAGTLHGRV